MYSRYVLLAFAALISSAIPLVTIGAQEKPSSLVERAGLKKTPPFDVFHNIELTSSQKDSVQKFKELYLAQAPTVNGHGLTKEEQLERIKDFREAMYRSMRKILQPDQRARFDVNVDSARKLFDKAISRSDTLNFSTKH